MGNGNYKQDDEGNPLPFLLHRASRLADTKYMIQLL